MSTSEDLDNMPEFKPGMPRDKMRMAMLEFLELSDYLDDQAIPETDEANER